MLHGEYLICLFFCCKKSSSIILLRWLFWLSLWNDHMNRFPVGMKDPAAWPSGKMVKFGDRKVKLVTWPWSHLKLRRERENPGTGRTGDVCGKK